MNWEADADNDENDVLDCIHGIKCVQQRLRTGGNPVTLIKEAAGYVKELPKDVARRLTEIDITALFSFNPDARTLAGQLASDTAFAQVIRAANTYREKCGLAPLEDDGWPEGIIVNKNGGKKN